MPSTRPDKNKLQFLGQLLCAPRTRQALDYLLTAMSSGLESAAVFASRALQVGMTEDELNALIAAKYDTMGRFAYCCNYQPAQPDETPLLRVYDKIFPAKQIGSPQEDSGSVSNFRRLFYESHTCAVIEMKSRLDHTEGEPVRQMQAPERAARHEAQEARLSGWRLSGEFECSHQLIDKVAHQFDSNELRYINLEDCTCREQEITGEKKDKKVEVAVRGGGKLEIAMGSEDDDYKADISTDLRVKNALIRRALAYDQCGLMDFKLQETWIARMFQAMAEPPMIGYHPTTLEQCLRTDKKIFIRMAELCRATILPSMGKPRPLDVAFTKVSESVEIQLLLAPLQKSMSSSAAAVRDGPYSKGHGKGGKSEHGKGHGKGGGGKGGGKSGKGKANSKGKRGKSSGPSSVPKGCQSQTSDGKYICYAFNDANGCQQGGNVQPGERCSKGFHVCGKRNCGGHHSLQVCTKA